MKFFFEKVNKLNKGPVPYEAEGFRSGFTLVETLVAISIFTVSILGMMSVLSQGISNTGYAKAKMTAAYLAQEGIEYLRNQRDTAVLYQGGGDWASFNVNSGPTTFATFFATFDNNFRRTIQKTVVNANESRISSTVSWTQGSGDYSVTFSKNLFNWY